MGMEMTIRAMELDPQNNEMSYENGQSLGRKDENLTALHTSYVKVVYIT